MCACLPSAVVTQSHSVQAHYVGRVADRRTHVQRHYTLLLRGPSGIIVCGEAPVNSTFGLVPALEFPCLLYQYCTWLGGYT